MLITGNSFLFGIRVHSAQTQRSQSKCKQFLKSYFALKKEPLRFDWEGFNIRFKTVKKKIVWRLPYYSAWILTCSLVGWKMFWIRTKCQTGKITLSGVGSGKSTIWTRIYLIRQANRKKSSIIDSLVARRKKLDNNYHIYKNWISTHRIVCLWKKSVRINFREDWEPVQ